MRQINEMINEASERLSRDFEVGVNVLSKQTKTWLKELDAAVERHNLNYDKCREAARKFKSGDFEDALKTIWGNRLEVDITRSEDGGNITTKTYTAADYATFVEKIEYKNGTFVHTITGRYSNPPTPGRYANVRYESSYPYHPTYGSASALPVNEHPQFHLQ